MNPRKAVTILLVAAACVSAVLWFRWYNNFEERLFVPGMEAVVEGRYSDAIRYLERYIEVRKMPLSDPYSALSLSYIESSKAYDKAEHVLKEGIRYVSGKHRDALRSDLATLYISTQRYSDAIDTYRSIESYSEAEKQYAIGYTHTLNRQYKEAIAFLSRAIQADPEVSSMHLPNIYILLARGHSEEGRASDAAKAIKDGIAGGHLTVEGIRDTKILPKSLKMQFIREQETPNQAL